MALDCSFQKWTAPQLANLSSGDSSVLRSIFTSVSAEFARYSKLIEEQCATIAADTAALVVERDRITALRTALSAVEATVATCCAGTTTTTTTPAPVTTTAAPGPGATTTPVPATTTTTVATTTTTVAPGASCFECYGTLVFEEKCRPKLNGQPGNSLQWRIGVQYDGTCLPFGCVGCFCPTTIVWDGWYSNGDPC